MLISLTLRRHLTQSRHGQMVAAGSPGISARRDRRFRLLWAQQQAARGLHFGGAQFLELHSVVRGASERALLNDF